MQTALVTGAPGFLGGALARRLADDGVQVKALARRPNRDRGIRDVPNIAIVMGDVTDADRMQEVVQGCDAVFHVAAALGGRMATQRRVNVEGTRNVMLAAARAKVGRAVFVSSIAVYGYGVAGRVTEETPLAPRRDPYNVTKAEAEAVVRQIGNERGLSYSIVRPGTIYGPGSGVWTRTLFKLAKRQPTLFIGDGSGSAHPIFVDDVVDLLVTTATHPAAAGEAFNCAPDPAPAWRAFLDGYGRLAGQMEPRWLGIPVWAGWILAHGIEFMLRLRGEPKDAPDAVRFLTRRVTYSMEKARDLLGWTAAVDLESGIERCAPYLREKGLLPHP